MKRRILSVLACSMLFTLRAGAAGGNYGDKAPDFPPGAFSDGGHYQLGDFQGKLLVLFFYESECPTCKGKIPERNVVVDQFKDKPVKFLAVSPHNAVSGAKAYITETHLKMPVFADNLNIMETLYEQDISLKNIYQFRVIGPDGGIVGYDMSPAEIEKALQNVKWKYKNEGYDPQLNGIIELLEWNQYVPALNQLRPLRKSHTKTLADSAEKLYLAVKAEGDKWKADADKVVETKPVEAFDLYSKVATVFAGDDLGKAVADSLKFLQKSKPIADELAARQMYGQLYNAVPRARPQQKADVVQFCESVAAKFPDTPTAEKAKTLAAALKKAPDAQ